MAGAAGSSSRRVEILERLRQEPWRLGFYTALRLVECAWPEKPRIGRSVHVGDDPIRLGQEPSLAFAPSTLAPLHPANDHRPARLPVYFFGLLGPNGPLPLHLTEYARNRLRNSDDPTFVAFCDIFHHRMLSLFSRAWAQAQPTVNLDRPEDDRFAVYVGAMAGLGMKSLMGRDALPDSAKLHWAGRLAGQTKNPEGLRAMIAGFLGMPVEIDEFVGQWLKLPADSLCRLGESPTTGTLGLTAVAGSRIWDCRQKFRIVLGPLRLEQFRRMLPGSKTKSMNRLVALVRNYIGDELAWDVNLVLRKEDVPPLRLGGDAQLGMTTWTSSQKAEEDARDVILNPLGDVA